MADLEDRILKQNVPGRWSSHEGSTSFARTEDVDPDDVDHDDDDDNGDGMPKTDDQELLDEARSLAAADVPETVRKSILAQRMRDKQTGVKGVLADYKAATAMAQAQALADAQQRAQIINRMVHGHIIKAEDQEPEEEEEELCLDEELEEGGFDDDEDAFMREYRQKRLAELKMQTSALPVFGRCIDVSSQDFLTEVDLADSRVFVIVHLYEPSVLTCVRMNRILDELAHLNQNVKFMRMAASNNMIEVDRMALPILTVYKGGATVEVHAGIAEELGEHFKREDIEYLIDSTIHPH